MQQSVEGSQNQPEGEYEDDLSNGELEDYAEEVESQQIADNGDSECSPEVTKKKPLKQFTKELKPAV